MCQFNDKGLASFFGMWASSFPAPLTEETLFIFLMYDSGIFVEIHLVVAM